MKGNDLIQYSLADESPRQHFRAPIHKTPLGAVLQASFTIGAMSAIIVAKKKGDFLT